MIGIIIGAILIIAVLAFDEKLDDWFGVAGSRTVRVILWVFGAGLIALFLYLRYVKT